MRPNLNLMKATLTGALGGLLFGFDTVVISGIIDSVVRLYGLSDYGKGWTVAIALIGTVVGSWGRRRGPQAGGRETLRLTAVLYVVRQWKRPGMELAVAHGVSIHRRSGNRSFVGSGPRLHRRTRSGKMARAARRCLPVQRRLRHSRGLSPPTT